MAIYACSDLHGCMWAWNEIKNRITENDWLYFIGDAIDRGPDGWQILKEALDMPNCTFILGNHEQMMLDAYKNNFEGHEFNVWYHNGNMPTCNAIWAEDPKEVKRIMDTIANLPAHIKICNESGDIIKICHSGAYSIDEERDWNWKEDLIWDRSHFYNTRWCDEENVYVVHGHTPIPYLVEEIRWLDDTIPEEIEPGSFWYCHGHKIDIDCGTFFTKTACLLNLDTFDEDVFKFEE